jgi:hypothetical protein
MREFKATEKRDESTVDLTRQGGNSVFAMSKFLHRVYLTWKHLRR